MSEYYGCGDSLCMFGPPDGMQTNGGCRCLQSMPRYVAADRGRLRRIERGVRSLRAEVERLEDDNKALLNIRQCYLENEKELNEIDELLGVSEQIDYSTDQRVKDILSDRKWLGKQHLKDRVAVERMVPVVEAAGAYEEAEVKLRDQVTELDRQEKGGDGE